MTKKKSSSNQEPLLSSFARTLGHAAGTITKATHELAENLSTLPVTFTTKVRAAAAASAKPSTNRQRSKNTSSSAKKSKPKTPSGGAVTRSPKKGASARRSLRKSTSRKK